MFFGIAGGGALDEEPARSLVVAAVLSDGFRNEIFVDRTSLIERDSLEGIGDGVVGLAYVQLRLATAFAKSGCDARGMIRAAVDPKDGKATGFLRAIRNLEEVNNKEGLQPVESSAEHT